MAKQGKARKESLVLQKELGLGVRPRPLTSPLSKLWGLGRVISNQCASGSSCGRTERAPTSFLVCFAPRGLHCLPVLSERLRSLILTSLQSAFRAWVVCTITHLCDLGCLVPTVAVFCSCKGRPASPFSPGQGLDALLLWV